MYDIISNWNVCCVYAVDIVHWNLNWVKFCCVIQSFLLLDILANDVVFIVIYDLGMMIMTKFFCSVF